MTAINGSSSEMQSPKEKKNNHVFHHSSLKCIMQLYDQERINLNKIAIPNNMIYTDNFPTQCKCCQNFIKMAKFGDDYDERTRLVNKFASKHAFKVPWDATGKIVKAVISRNEFKLDRCTNAMDCYLKLMKDTSKVTNMKKMSN